MEVKYWRTFHAVEETTVSTHVEHYTCLTCGALVSDRTQHTSWHQSMSDANGKK